MGINIRFPAGFVPGRRALAEPLRPGIPRRATVTSSSAKSSLAFGQSSAARSDLCERFYNTVARHGENFFQTKQASKLKIQHLMNPLLRWAGSKRKVLAELRSQSPLTFGRYFEPFAGSAVLFFDLMPNVAVLGDLNPEVVATYEAVRDTPDQVCRYLYSIPRTTDGYYSVRSLSPERLSASQRAARLIFLMKSCFNGVYRTNQQGKFNVPLGNKFFALPTEEEVMAASSALQQVDVIKGDFEEAIRTAEEGDFVYLDPPYSDGSRFRGEYSYQGSFQASDQRRLVDACDDLTRRGVKVVLSFKECEALCNALDGWSLTRITVNRSVAGFARARRFANEILARNF